MVATVATVVPSVVDEMLLWWNKHDCGSYCGYCGTYCQYRNATLVATVVPIVDLEMLLWLLWYLLR